MGRRLIIKQENDAGSNKIGPVIQSGRLVGLERIRVKQGNPSWLEAVTGGLPVFRR